MESRVEELILKGESLISEAESLMGEEQRRARLEKAEGYQKRLDRIYSELDKIHHHIEFIKRQIPLTENSIGERIKALRKPMTQQELAIELNHYYKDNKISARKTYTKDDVEQWENGLKILRSDNIIALATVLKTDCHYLLTGTEANNVNFTPEAVQRMIYELENSVKHQSYWGD